MKRTAPRPRPAGVFLPGRSVAALAVLLACAGAARAYAQEPPAVSRGPEVQAVRFPGAHSLAPAALQGAIATRPGKCKSPLVFLPCLVADWDWAERKAFLDPAELPRDEERLETLYEIWGFPEARVSARALPQRDGDVVVVFEIDEGQPILIESIEVRGLDTLAPPQRLPARLPLAAGRPYALPQLEATQRLITSELAERGRPYAQVEVSGEVDAAAQRARVILEVKPGPVARFGPVTIQAEPPLEDEVVRERLAFRAGERFRPSALERTEEALFDLPVVERAAAEPVRAESADTLVPTVVAVTTRRVQGVELEGTVSSTDCLEIAGFWRHRYFLGGPRLFSFGGGFSNLLASQLDGGFPCTSTGAGAFARPEYFVRAEMRQPWPGHPAASILLRGFFAREAAPRAYVRVGYGAELALARTLGPRLVASIGFLPERNELEAADIYFCGNFGVCDDAAIDRLARPTTHAPLELLLVRPPRDGPGLVRRPGAEPDRRRRGWSWVRAGVSTAGSYTGSDYRYTRGLAEAALTRLFGDRFELAARARAAALAGSEELLPPQLRLYSGGVSSVRGVAQNLLGPKLLVAARDNLDELGCQPQPGGCEGVPVEPRLVAARPTGGEAVVEANLEGRVWLGDSFQLAAFADLGVLWRTLDGGADALGTVRGVALVTPGLGVRVLTGLGPIRVDVGYDPSGPHRYPLLAGDPEGGGLLFLGNVTYDPFEHDDPGFLKELWRRLQLHVAIGQPF